MLSITTSWFIGQDEFMQRKFVVICYNKFSLVIVLFVFFDRGLGLHKPQACGGLSWLRPHIPARYGCM